MSAGAGLAKAVVVEFLAATLARRRAVGTGVRSLHCDCRAELSEQERNDEVVLRGQKWERVGLGALGGVRERQSGDARFCESCTETCHTGRSTSDRSLSKLIEALAQTRRWLVHFPRALGSYLGMFVCTI